MNQNTTIEQAKSEIIIIETLPAYAERVFRADLNNITGSEGIVETFKNTSTGEITSFLKYSNSKGKTINTEIKESMNLYGYKETPSIKEFCEIKLTKPYYIYNT